MHRCLLNSKTQVYIILKLTSQLDFYVKAATFSNGRFLIDIEGCTCYGD